MLSLLKTAELKALEGQGLTSAEAVEFTKIPLKDIFEVLSVTERVRRHFKGDAVNLCSIVNAKSGLCGEDCSFCPQSVHHGAGNAGDGGDKADAKTYPMVAAQAIVEAARGAEGAGANEFSIVTSGRGIEKEDELETLVEALKGVGVATDLERCASLGILEKEDLERLKKAGLTSFHHNLETSRSFFPNVCTTHDYDDDVGVVRTAKGLGLYVCSGGVFGLGESWVQRVELAVTLRELDVDSVPLNFLNPRPGTPLEGAANLSPMECLMIIALFRLMLPKKDILVCGGREVNLRDLQPLIFAAGANGTMLGNYLTTEGRRPEDDLRMIEDLGLKQRDGSVTLNPDKRA